MNLIKTQVLIHSKNPHKPSQISNTTQIQFFFIFSFFSSQFFKSKYFTKAFILDLSQMEKPCCLRPIPVFFFIFLITTFPSSSLARSLNKPLKLAANEPLLELELPEENVAVVAYSLDKESHHVLPCDMEPSKPKLGFPYKAPRLAGKYGRLLLSREVQTPPSGPSRRIHDNNN